MSEKIKKVDSVKISKIEDQPEIKLGNNYADGLNVIQKSVLSNIPIFGALLAELISVSIPNQRIDRLEKFTINLSKKINNLPDEIRLIVAEKLKDTISLPFVEKVLQEAIKAESEEKLRYLASVLKNGLTKDYDAIYRERLFKIFRELNEIEIIRLYLASLDQYSQEYESFEEKYIDLLFYEAPFDGTDDEIEKEQIALMYSQNLVDLKLITETNVSGRTTNLGLEILKLIDAKENFEVKM